MGDQQTPYLRLNYGTDAERNQNWAKLDRRLYEALSGLFANVPAGGDLQGYYPAPLINAPVIDRVPGNVLTIAADGTLDWKTPTGGGGGGGGPALVSIGPTAPPTPSVGQLWWRTTDGNLYIYYFDGATYQWVPAMASVGKLIAGQYYLVAGALAGTPTASLSIGLYVAALAFTFPANLTGSQAVAKTAATAAADVTILVNGASKGTIHWAAGATVATFVFAASVAVAAGDRIELVAPATPDATLADFTWTIRGAI